MVRHLVIDAGPLIDAERKPVTANRIIALAKDGVALHVSTGVVAQVVRKPQQQVKLRRLLGLMRARDIDRHDAVHVGLLLSGTNGKDVVDGHVALMALELGCPVWTNDHKDFTAFNNLKILT